MLLCSIIMQQYTLQCTIHRDSSANLPLPPDQHHISDVAVWGYCSRGAAVCNVLELNLQLYCVGRYNAVCGWWWRRWFSHTASRQYFETATGVHSCPLFKRTLSFYCECAEEIFAAVWHLPGDATVRMGHATNCPACCQCRRPISLEFCGILSVCASPWTHQC